jgi:hypothetical protein
VLLECYTGRKRMIAVLAIEPFLYGLFGSGEVTLGKSINPLT